eukprot:TRINITY_DN3208_c0_g1_i5.p1 TRINITY_DN3208_c0_g1~~TRINITY_DN3208_c0_g1_i5.p1  ORF type:complete len:1569 (-),score=239.63 TRINITY_DN3208_c0_g1_i5:13-4719(-)
MCIRDSNNIMRADDIMDFVANADGTGYLELYPEVKFIYAHYFQVLIPGNISRQGARMDIILPVGTTFKNQDTINPLDKGFVTYSADQVAVYKTTYDPVTRTISAFFKRGLMPNEAYGKPSLIGIMFEELSSAVDISATLRISELKYDISAPELNYERFTLREEKSIVLLKDRFLSLPAAELHVKINRRNCTDIFPYELLEPYTRIGVHFQELLKHRTIWGSAESHHVSDPGVQAINAAFSLISAIGISSIPFVEYVTVGKSQLIPSGPSTTRLEWGDIWGRNWSQPLRTMFPDIVPLPGPVRNFMITTTFELTKAGTTQRILEWNSDETMDLRVQVKLLNNYPKYFKITGCKDNEVAYVKETATENKWRIYDPPPYPYQLDATSTPNNFYYVAFGHRSVYGMCFDEEGTVLKGTNVSAIDRARIATAYLCADTLNETKMLECSKQLADLPTVTRRSGTNTPPIWMYSPEVDRYYPQNYIKPDMWDMTAPDYDDSPMMKAMEYHMDNTLPGMDLGANPPVCKPHNVVAQPLFKGFGIQITYTNQLTLKKFPQYKGWWSDNLQNKDDTLLAGQQVSNDVSVHKQTLLPSSVWINAKELTSSGTKAIVDKRLKNIHTCLYNQHRVITKATQERYTFLSNVYQNNIIPIIPDLEKDDPRLTSYDCSGVYQYSPTNISQVDNRLITPTIRDWLYFSANLRGGAKETINIPFTLAPFSKVKVEGMTKVQDGGRFVYWNPCCGPNTFQMVDSVVNVIDAKRSDLTISCEVFPKTTTTFKPVLYHLMHIEDPAEINRVWNYITYTNNYGFGDATISIFVGGAQATRAIVNAGEYTIVKITYFNNAGFDWNMYGSAIDFEYVGSQPINAMDLMLGKKHSIQSPKKYNFMILTIPTEIKDYITIVPSDHNIDVAPQFFDLTNINVVTIRDGFKGDYYYRINVTADIPDSLRGKVYDIQVTLNESCFDKLPGYNDPTGSYHDYKLKIPAIRFGIPYATGPNAGKVFYTSGYSTNLIITASVPNYWKVDSAKIVSDADVGTMRLAAGDPDNYKQKLEDFWTALPTPIIPITSVASGTDGLLTLDMSSVFPTFPLKNGNEPDIAKFNVLLKCSTPQLAYGTVRVISRPMIYFSDFTGKRKSDIIAQPLDKSVASKGAWLQVSYSALVGTLTGSVFTASSSQSIFKADKEVTMKVLIKTKNVGTDTAYYTNMTLSVVQGVAFLTNYIPPGISYTVTNTDGGDVLKMNTKRSFAAGDLQSEVVYIKFNAPTARRLLASTTGFTVIKSVSADIDLTATSGSVQVSQTMSTPLSLSVITNDRDSVTLFVTAQFVNGKPVFTLKGTAKPSLTLAGKNVRYQFYRQVVSVDCDNDVNSPATGTCSALTAGKVTLGSLSESNLFQDKPISDSFTGYVRSGVYRYTVETYSETKQMLASTIVERVLEKPAEAAKPNNGNQQDINNQANNTSGDPSNVTRPIIRNQTNETITDASDSQKGEYYLPLWAIILIPVAALLVILIAAVLIYRKYKLVKVHQDTTSQEVAIQEVVPENKEEVKVIPQLFNLYSCLLYTSPSPRDATLSRMPSSA